LVKSLQTWHAQSVNDFRAMFGCREFELSRPTLQAFLAVPIGVKASVLRRYWRL
jgi:hypothetical protein